MNGRYSGTTLQHLTLLACGADCVVEPKRLYICLSDKGYPFRETGLWRVQTNREPQQLQMHTKQVCYRETLLPSVHLKTAATAIRHPV